MFDALGFRPPATPTSTIAAVRLGPRRRRPVRRRAGAESELHLQPSTPSTARPSVAGLRVTDADGAAVIESAVDWSSRARATRPDGRRGRPATRRRDRRGAASSTPRASSDPDEAMRRLPRPDLDLDLNCRRATSEYGSDDTDAAGRITWAQLQAPAASTAPATTDIALTRPRPLRRRPRTVVSARSSTATHRRRRGQPRCGALQRRRQLDGSACRTDGPGATFEITTGSGTTDGDGPYDDPPAGVCSARSPRPPNFDRRPARHRPRRPRPPPRCPSHRHRQRARPNANAGGPYRHRTHRRRVGAVTLDARGSTDPDGVCDDIARYALGRDDDGKLQRSHRCHRVNYTNPGWRVGLEQTVRAAGVRLLRRLLHAPPKPTIAVAPRRRPPADVSPRRDVVGPRRPGRGTDVRHPLSRPRGRACDRHRADGRPRGHLHVRTPANGQPPSRWRWRWTARPWRRATSTCRCASTTARAA